MIHQFNAQRFRHWHGKRVGTIPAGTIIYIQDDVRPLSGITHIPISRNPWIVEAWNTRETLTGYAAGGHLATVRSLRDGRRQTVADWILLTCIDAGLDAHVIPWAKAVSRKAVTR